MLKGVPQIRNLRQLCRHLRCKTAELQRICTQADQYYHEFTDKGRPISEPFGQLKFLQQRVKILLSGIELPEYMHGGVKGRSPLTNACLHINKSAVLNFDIKQFFPSVKPRYVYEMFYKNLRFPADVAHWLTKLVTFKGQLPQGAPTSTIVANLVILPLCRRLKLLSSKHNSDYGQFVDDGTFSGPMYLENLRNLIEKIIHQEGFQASPKPHKRTTCYYWEEQVVNGVRVDKGIDAPKQKINGIKSELNEIFIATRSGQKIPRKKIASIKGKIQHIKTLNRQKGESLENRLRNILNKAS
jgi:RNA-directed DNA polymerase